MAITKLCAHNTGGMGNDPLAKSSHLTWQQINNAHQARNFNLSEMGYYIGYSVLIFPNGEHMQTRLLGEQTAAAKGSNFDSIHICLLGNFTKGSETPTILQKTKLINIMRALLDNSPERFNLKVKTGTVFNLSKDRIYPHRLLQPNTSCYGNSLSDSWAKELIHTIADDERMNLLIRIKQLSEIVLELLLLLKRQRFGFKSDKRTISCSECDVLG